MIGATLALVSAAFFGLNNATVRRGVLKSTVLQGMAITVPVGVPMFLLFAIYFGGMDQLRTWGGAAWIWMILAGVVHFVVGRFGNYRATQALGATLSTPIQQLSILVAVALAFVFLDERINAVNAFGIFLVMVGPLMVVGRRKSAKKAAASGGFEPQYGPGMFWGAVCAFGYGVSPLFIALGLGEAPKMADGVAGVLVSYVAATVVVVIMVMFAGGKVYMSSLDRGSAGWFLISAAFVAMSQMFRYLALTIAPVSVVVPIQRLSVVFRLLFNAAINREHEVFDRWVIFSIFMSLAGAAALSLDTDMVLRFLFVPDGMIVVLSRSIF